MMKLEIMGVPVAEGFDVFALSRAWRKLGRPDPKLIFVSGLQLMNSSEDQGRSQYTSFGEKARKYDRQAKEHFFAVAADSIASDFPNTLVVFLQHTPNMSWPATPAWSASPAFLRMEAKSTKGGFQLVNWKYNDKGEAVPFAGTYQAVVYGRGVAARAAPFIREARAGRPYPMLDVFPLVRAALQKGPVLSVASNLFTNQLALATYVQKGGRAPSSTTFADFDDLPLSVRNLRYGGTNFNLTYHQMLEQFPHEEPSTLAQWWFDYGPAGANTDHDREHNQCDADSDSDESDESSTNDEQRRTRADIDASDVRQPDE